MNKVMWFDVPVKNIDHAAEFYKIYWLGCAAQASTR